MRTILRYEAGRAIWSDNEPDCRGRITASGPIGGTSAGAFPVAFVTPAVERPASHHATVGRTARAPRRKGAGL